jgi:hypothetical protein
VTEEEGPPWTAVLLIQPCSTKRADTSAAALVHASTVIVDVGPDRSRPRGSRAALVRAGVLACLIGAAAACGGSARQSYTFGQTSATRFPPTVSTPARFPQAPAAITRAAVKIALADRTLRGLLVRSRYRIAGASVWRDFDGHRIGAAVSVALDNAISVDMDIPCVTAPPDAPGSGDCRKPNAPGWEHLRAARIRQLDAFIDLRSSKLVAI